MKEGEEPKMLQCPVPSCSVELPEDDKLAQDRHIEERHPEIVAKRRRESGMHREAEKFLAKNE